MSQGTTTLQQRYQSMIEMKPSGVNAPWTRIDPNALSAYKDNDNIELRLCVFAQSDEADAKELSELLSLMHSKLEFEGEMDDLKTIEKRISEGKKLSAFAYAQQRVTTDPLLQLLGIDSL